MTEILRVHHSTPDPALCAQAAAILRGGGTVAFPTETVYGLGANALSADAVSKIYLAKGRPGNNPLIVHVASVAAARRCVANWTEDATRLTDKFWPGPLTIVLSKADLVPSITTGGGSTVALRIPNHPVALALLNACDLPIAAPSANRSNRISPVTAAHVLQTLDGRIDAILDGGTCRVGVESTVVDLSGERPTLLRPGGITAAQLREVLPDLQFGAHLTDAARSSLSQDTDLARPSPGMLKRHYCPQARLECHSNGIARVAELIAAGKSVAHLSQHDAATSVPGVRLFIRMPSDHADYASRLYSALHECDAAKVEFIVVDLPPPDEAWLAVRDRLKRAASVWPGL